MMADSNHDLTPAQQEILADARAACAASRSELREVQAELEQIEAEREAALKASRSRVEALELELTKHQAAKRHQLPDVLASRITGNNADEIEADARHLASLYPANGRDPEGLQGGLSGDHQRGDWRKTIGVNHHSARSAYQAGNPHERIT